MSIRDGLNYLLSEKKELNINSKEDHIIFGLNWSYAFEYFLNEIKLPKTLKPLVRAISERTISEKIEIIDEDLSNIIGCSRSTIVRGRQRLADFENKTGISLIEIEEGIFELIHIEGKKKPIYNFKPTKYKSKFLDLIYDALVDAYNYHSYKDNRIEAIEIAIRSKIKDVSKESDWKIRELKIKNRPVSAEHHTARKLFYNSVVKCFDYTHLGQKRTLIGESEILITIIDLVRERYEERKLNSDFKSYLILDDDEKINEQKEIFEQMESDFLDFGW